MAYTLPKMHIRPCDIHSLSAQDSGSAMPILFKSGQRYYLRCAMCGIHTDLFLKPSDAFIAWNKRQVSYAKKEENNGQKD